MPAHKERDQSLLSAPLGANHRQKKGEKTERTSRGNLELREERCWEAHVESVKVKNTGDVTEMSSEERVSFFEGV